MSYPDKTRYNQKVIFFHLQLFDGIALTLTYGLPKNINVVKRKRIYGI